MGEQLNGEDDTVVGSRRVRKQIKRSSQIAVCGVRYARTRHGIHRSKSIQSGQLTRGLLFGLITLEYFIRTERLRACA